MTGRCQGERKCCYSHILFDTHFFLLSSAAAYLDHPLDEQRAASSSEQGGRVLGGSRNRPRQLTAPSGRGGAAHLAAVCTSNVVMCLGFALHTHWQVRAILCGDHAPLPFLIFGPPGTGNRGCLWPSFGALTCTWSLSATMCARHSLICFKSNTHTMCVVCCHASKTMTLTEAATQVRRGGDASSIEC